MAVDFGKLAEESTREIDRIRATNHTEPIQFLRTRFGEIDDFLIDQLRLQRSYAKEQEKVNGEQEEREENLFKQLQTVIRYQEKIYSSDIPFELYYFLYDVQKDFSRDDRCYIIAAGDDVRKIRMSEIFMNREYLRSYVDVDEMDLSGLDIDPHIIFLPRNELLNPFSYTLIAHEIFHDFQDSVENLKSRLNYLEGDVPDSELVELCVDALSMNYIGPAYAPALLNLHDKIDEQNIAPYPDIEIRIELVFDYLNYCLEVVQDHPVFEEIIKNEVRLLEDKRDTSSIPYSVSNFDELNNQVESIFDEKNIPTFVGEFDSLHETLDIDPTQENSLKEILDILLEVGRVSGNPRPVSMAIKPVLLFNLLLVMDHRETGELQTAVLASLRKWFARNQFGV